MAEQISIEQRVAALEKEVLELKQQLQASKPSANWLDQISGSMEEFPEFEEVIRYGREMRQADRDSDDKPNA
jgi:hypothetical protein